MTKNELIKELMKCEGVEIITVRPNQTVEIAVWENATYPYDKITDGPKLILNITLDKE